MHVPFETLPKTARVWIYQADRALTLKNIQSLEQNAITFCNQWAAHGVALKSSFKFLHNRFLILAVDEQANMASGCSIDSSVNFVRSLEQNLNVGFLDRTKVAFVINNEVFLESLANMKSKVEKGEITASTITFNNLVSNIEEFEENWQTEAGNSWLKKYF
jgi:hypothetical protein